MAVASLGSLLSQVRALELVARRNVTSTLSGNYVTSIQGRGMEFHEARRYVVGDPVRHIDWKMTARLGVPYVRTYLEERQREIFIALDTSPSMHTGWQDRSKLDLAVETAATIAVSALDAGDRLGFLTFSDRVHDVSRPIAGKRQLFRALRRFARVVRETPEPCGESDPRSAFHAIQALRGRRFVVFVISDFIDHDVPEDVRYVQMRHDVSLLHIYDPVEYAPRSTVRLPMLAPEGRSIVTSVRPGETGSLDAMQRFLRQACRQYGIAVSSISARDPVGGLLAAHFHRRRRGLG